MWKPFENENSLYMMKINENDNTFTVQLTDLRNIWSEELPKQSIMLRFQTSNPTFEVKLEDAVLEMKKLIEKIEHTSVSIDKSDEIIKMNIKSEVLGGFDSKFKVQFNFTLKIAEELQFIEQITVPMIHTIKYLEEQQKRLCDLLEKKDREIEEHVLEKGSITRKDLVSEKLDISGIREKNDEKLLLNVFEKSAPFWNQLVNKYGNVELQVLEVEKEGWNNVKRRKKVYSKNTLKKAGKIEYKK